jgi:hypothetical protein
MYANTAFSGQFLASIVYVHKGRQGEDERPLLAPRPVELLLYFSGTVADRFDNLLQFRRRDIELPGPGPDLPAVLHIDLRPVGLNRLGQRAHKCALATIARENRVTAKASDTSSASRSSFFFRVGWFCAIEEMTDERSKGSDVRVVHAIRLTFVGISAVDGGSAWALNQSRPVRPASSGLDDAGHLTLVPMVSTSRKLHRNLCLGALFLSGEYTHAGRI